MNESKHSKLSAMAADYYPSSAPSDLPANMVAYSRNYAYGPPYHPAAAQMSPPIPPFLLHSAPIPFQSPFMYIRPSFVDGGLPINAIPQFPPSISDIRPAELPQSNFVANNRSIHQTRNRPRSAQVRPPPAPQLESDKPETTSASKSRKKKKKSKKNGDVSTNDLTDALADVNLKDNNDTTKTLSSSPSTSAPPHSYSDVLKRPPPCAQPVAKLENEVNDSDVTLLNPVVEEFPALNAAKQLREPPAKVLSSTSPRQPQRGILHVPVGAIESNKQPKLLETFKLNMAAATPVVSNSPQKKQKSSSRNERASSPEQLAKQVGGTATTPVKKSSSSSLPDGSSSTATGTSPDRKPKYSKLKKVILEERKKRQQQQHSAEPDEGELSAALDNSTTGGDISEHDSNTKVENGTAPEIEKVEIALPSSKSSPQKTSNALGNVCNAYLSSALSGLSKEDSDAICRRLHRRRFREYCNQVLGAALDDAAYLLLTTLGGFQQRQYEQNPAKAKLRRRYVCGLREAVKHIQLGKAKCIILAPNIERIPGKGGLDDMIGSIIFQCASKNVPVVFALGRVALGRACSKPSPVSSVAIITPAGAEDKFKQMVELAQRAHESYVELVKMAVAEQIEQREHASKHANQPEKTFSSHVSGAHVQFPPCHQLGHSRNASNISAISFISNVSAVSDNSVGGLNNMPSNDTPEEDDGKSKARRNLSESDDDDDLDQEAGNVDDFEEDDEQDSTDGEHNTVSSIKNDEMI